MTGPVSELITDAVALTVLPDITTFAVRANMVDDALCIGSLAVNVTFIVSPDFASVAFEMQVYDHAGNSLTLTQSDLTSSNILVDNTSPTKQQLEISSSNSNATLAKSGDTINVTLTASEPIQSASSTIFARTANVVISGNTVKATASVISSDTGSVTFEMQVYDHAGNSLTLTQSDLTSSNILVDNTSPTKQQLEISSSNSNATLAKSGDTINVTLTASEPIQSASSTIFARTANVVISGNTVKATASVISSDTGPVTFEMQVYDHAGNSLTLTQSDLTSSNILVDNTSPTKQQLEISSSNSNATLAKSGDTINVTLTASEPIQSASSTIFTRTANIVISGNTVEATASVISSDTGPVTFEMQVYDHAGNSLTLTQSDLTSSNVLIDNTSPTKQQLEISSSNSNATLAKSGDTINVTLTASEPIQSASSTIFARTANIVISGNTVEATASIISSDTGSATFEMQVYDHAGNSLTLTQSDLTSSNVLIDNTSPTKQQLEISSSNSNATLAKSGDTINVTLTASEPIQSASSTIFARTANIVISGNTVKATASIISSDTGPATFEMQVYDHAGNSLTLTQSDLTSSNILVDTTSPPKQNLEISSSNSNATLAKSGDTINVTLTASEPIQSASSTIFTRTANIVISGNTVEATASVISSDTGPATFEMQVYDYAGNSLTLTQSDLTSSNVLIDNTSPTKQQLEISSSNSNATLAKSGDTITVTLTASEPIQSASSTIFARTANVAISGNTVKATASVISSDTGSATFEIKVYDYANHSLTLTQSDLTSSNILVDNNVPSETNLEIYSDNTRDSLLANTGDMVSICHNTFS